jgi:hypothetical protein
VFSRVQISVAHIYVNKIVKSPIQEDDLWSALMHIATTQVHEREQVSWFSYREDWVKPLLSMGFLNEPDARRLYKEALSGGLIVEEQQYQWQWSYPWIRDYLALVSEQ